MNDLRLSKVENGYVAEMSGGRIIPRKRFVAKTLEAVLDLVKQWDAAPEPAEPVGESDDDEMEDR